jgi:hypothetical protein
VIVDPVAATRAGQPSGLTNLIWGLGASVMGVTLVANLWGFADKLEQWEKPWWLPLRIPQRGLRILGVPFVIAGPVYIVIGSVMISRGQ